MIESQWFSLSPTPATIAFAVLLLVGCVVLSMITIGRSQFKRSIMALECLRLLLVALVGLAICQPEWLQQFLPKDDPVVTVLWDQSGSMQTEDVQSPSGESVARLDAIASLIDSETWSPCEEKMKVVIEPFSSQLSNPQQGSDLNAALSAVAQSHSNLRAVVMISDGGWNIGGSPTEAATQLRMRDVPVYAVAVGSEYALPDVEVTSLDAPTFGVVNKPTRIPFSISSTMAKDVSVTVTLTSSDGDEMAGNFTVAANDVLRSAFVWNPRKTGQYTLTLDVSASSGERLMANNTLSAPIDIRKESLKVLVVDSFPRWEYRYLKNALVRDPGVEVESVLYLPGNKRRGGGKGYLKDFPQTLEELSKFDVILLGDVGIGEKQLTLNDCRNIKGVVQNQATGLILMPGLRGRQLSLVETDLKELFPVLFDSAQPKGWGNSEASQFQLTEAGSESLLTKLADSPKANESIWRSLPGFQWYAPVLRAKVGSRVLAVHDRESNENGRIALLVTKTFGAGKILFMGTDGAWRWREGVEDKYHYRFWGQVARWMAYQRNMVGGDSMRLFYSPDRPRTGQTLTVNANVMDISGAPLQNGTVSVQIVASSGATKLIKLATDTQSDQWGLFTGYFVPEENGDHQATLFCKETGASITTSINVQGQQREKLGRPANLETLQEITAITRGKMISTADTEQLIETIGMIPEPDPQIRRIRLWAHPIWAGAMILLLGLFWTGRKFAGVI